MTPQRLVDIQSLDAEDIQYLDSSSDPSAAEPRRGNHSCTPFCKSLHPTDQTGNLSVAVTQCSDTSELSSEAVGVENISNAKFSNRFLTERNIEEDENIEVRTKSSFVLQDDVNRRTLMESGATSDEHCHVTHPQEDNMELTELMPPVDDEEWAADDAFWFSEELPATSCTSMPLESPTLLKSDKQPKAKEPVSLEEEVVNDNDNENEENKEVRIYSPTQCSETLIYMFNVTVTFTL